MTSLLSGWAEWTRPGAWISEHGQKIDESRKAGHLETEKLYADHFVSFLSLALAGVRKQPDTRLMKLDPAHFWTIDKRKEEVSNALPTILPVTLRDVVGGIAQAGLRAWNEDGRDKLKEFGDVFEFVCKAFPIDSLEPNLNMKIRKLWDHALKGWGFCIQTYREDRSDFGNWIRSIDVKYHAYIQPKSFEKRDATLVASQSSLPVMILKTRQVWNDARIKAILDSLTLIDSGQKATAEGISLTNEYIYKLFELGHLDFVTQMNREVSSLVWNVEGAIRREVKQGRDEPPASKVQEDLSKELKAADGTNRQDSALEEKELNISKEQEDLSKELKAASEQGDMEISKATQDLQLHQEDAQEESPALSLASEALASEEQPPVKQPKKKKK